LQDIEGMGITPSILMVAELQVCVCTSFILSNLDLGHRLILVSVWMQP